MVIAQTNITRKWKMPLQRAMIHMLHDHIRWWRWHQRKAYNDFRDMNMCMNKHIQRKASDNDMFVVILIHEVEQSSTLGFSGGKNLQGSIGIILEYYWDNNKKFSKMFKINCLKGFKSQMDHRLKWWNKLKQGDINKIKKKIVNKISRIEYTGSQ